MTHGAVEGSASVASNAESTETGGSAESGSSIGSSMGSESSPSSTGQTASTSSPETTATTANDTSSASDPTDEASAGSSGDPLPSMHLQHGSHAGCDVPLWCFGFDVSDPAGGAHAGQECFTAPSSPVSITSIQYSVGGVAAELDSFALEVRERAGGEPGALVISIPMTANDATVGAHVYDPPAPIVVEASDFCVGFRTTAPGLAGALGFGVSEDSVLPGTSWVSSGECLVAEWSDSLAVAVEPIGNWCIAVDIE